MKRLGIYFFYDKEGIVDDYVPYYLNALKPFCSELCVVVNGILNDEGRKKLETCSDKLIVRVNKGLDSWASKETIESYGYEAIKEYDELLLNNFTSFGPIYPFSIMFDKMANKECDFWGHCRYFSQSSKVRNQPIPNHLMSHFVVFRKNILESFYFKYYWDTLQEVNNYDDARLYHEFRLTPYFENLGFVSSSFIDDEINVKYPDINTSVLCTYNQLKENKSPILKRKALFVSKAQYPFGDKTPHNFNKTIKYIYKRKLYDLNLCFSNLIRTKNFSYRTRNINAFKVRKYNILGKLFRIKKYVERMNKYVDIALIEKILNRK